MTPLSEQTAQLLIESLNNLTSTITQKKQSSDDKDWWHLSDLIKYFELSEASIRKIIARPDFPKPFKPLPGQRSESLWHRDDVKRWALTNKERITKTRPRG